MFRKVSSLALNYFSSYYFNLAFSTLCLLFFLTQSLGSNLEYYYYLLLFGSVIIVYNSDFLMDNTSNFREARAKFPFRVFLILAFFLGNTALAIYLVGIDFSLILKGIGLMGLVGIYFFLLKFYRYFYLVKELMVAFVFSFALLALFVDKLSNDQSGQSDQSDQLWAINFFSIFLISLHNALIFSIANFEKDQNNETSSIITHFGKEKMTKVTDGVGFLGVLFILFSRQDPAGAWLPFYLVLVLLAQGILLKKHADLSKKKKFYLIGNSIFLLTFLLYFPIVFLLRANL